MSALYSRAVALTQLGQTRRYHTELCLLPQDVAQHSFNVAWFCWLLSNEEPSIELIMSALAHDGGERKTGDVPSPTKKLLGVGAAFDELERAHMQEKVGYLRARLSQPELDILKLADLLDGCFYCLRELRLGNTIVLDEDRGGAALNFLNYLSAQLHKVESPFVRKKAFELEINLRTEFKRYAPAYLSAPI